MTEGDGEDSDEDVFDFRLNDGDDEESVATTPKPSKRNGVSPTSRSNPTGESYPRSAASENVTTLKRKEDSLKVNGNPSSNNLPEATSSPPPPRPPPKQGEPQRPQEPTRRTPLTFSTCTTCREGFEEWETQRSGDGQTFCLPCYADRFLPKCRKCRLPIEGGAVTSSDGKVAGKVRFRFRFHRLAPGVQQRY